jgi:corrinoid protein of di/trimethylamine methyltransferase
LIKNLKKEQFSMDLFEQIVEATVAGDQERCVALAQQVLDTGADPLQAIEQGYTAGMTIVGDKFSRMEYYLPELIRCADAMKAAMDVLKPHLGKNQDTGMKGTIVLGTIQGDLHDLGKNIVKTMLQAAGFTVHDLGCDVQLRSFIEKAEEQDADLIAASAILTTTMAYMPDLVNLLSDMNLRDTVKVMVGGAPVTPDYAEQFGADGYGANAAEAVETAKRLVQSKKERE